MDRAALSRQCEQAEQRSVLVVDDDLRNIRLVGSLLTESGFRVHVADNGLLALAIAREVQPDLVLLDILLPPRMNGIETCHRLKVCPDTRAIPVIFLTGKEDEETMVRAFEVGGADYVQKPFNAQVLLARVRTHTELDYQDLMFKAGAAAFVLKNEAIGELVHAIKAALRGERLISPSVSQQDNPISGRSKHLDKRTLSEREIEVLRFLAQGRRTREIAELLGISGKTVETYRSRILMKVGVDNLAELVKFAIRAGITSMEI